MQIINTLLYVFVVVGAIYLNFIIDDITNSLLVKSGFELMFLKLSPIIIIFIATIYFTIIFYNMKFLQKANQFREAVESSNINRRFEIEEFRDELTGIANKIRFTEVVNEGIKKMEGSHLSLILFNVDYLKEINALFGKSVGDSVIVGIVAVVKAKIRNYDFFARVSGADFALFVKVDGETALLISEKLRRAIESYEFINNYQITCSFGVGEYVLGDTFETLLKKGENGLHKAKESGRNLIERGSL